MTISIGNYAQTPPTLGDYQSVTSGNWSDLTTWQRFNGSDWVAPTAVQGYPGQNTGTDDVTIQDGTTITINISPAQSISGLYVGEGISGVLQYDASEAQSLHVSGIVTIGQGAIFCSPSTGTVNTHQLVVETGIINQGTLDFSTNTTGVGITFVGNSNGLFDLSTATRTNLMDSNGLVLNKGGYVLSFTPGGIFQVLSGNAVGFLTIQSGNFNLIGGNSFSNPLFNASTGSYTIPSGGGFRLDNPNATIVGMNGTFTNNGEVIIRNGVYNVGNSTGNELLTTSTGRFEMSGGVMNISGRFRNDGGECNITGGILNLATIGHADSRLAAFYMSDMSDLTISGNPLITFTYPNTNPIHFNDIEIVAGAGQKTISGGTFQLGRGNNLTDRTFLVNSDIPVYNMVVNNAHTIISLTDHLTINNQLTLNGRLILGNYNLILGSPAILGTFGANDGMIVAGLGNGEVHKTINGLGNYVFPFGSTNYLPVTLNITGGTFTPGATVSVRMVDSKQPQNTNTINYLTRYWRVGISGITNLQYNFTGTYASGDVVGQDGWMTTGVYTTAWRKLSAANNIGYTIYASGLTENADITGINAAAAAPQVTVTATPASVCSGSTVQLIPTVTGIGPFTYSWTSSPAGYTSTDANPIVNPVNNTTYTVTVADGMGGAATASVTVTINPELPVSVSIVASDNTVCAGTPVTFTASPENGGLNPTYQWKVNGNNVNDNDATYNYVPSNGDIVTCVLTSNATCATGSPATSNVVTMTVYPMLTATISGTTEVCQNDPSPSVIFTGNSGSSPYTFTYRIDNGSNATISTTTGNSVTLPVSTANAGTFIYTLVSVQDANCSQLQNETATITVNPLPQATASSNSPQCAGSTLTLTASGGSIYRWTGPNNFSSTLQNPAIANVSVAAAGTYTVTVTDANGCVATASTTVVVNPSPTVSITANPGNTICSGTNVTFTTNVNHAGANPAFQWRIDNVDVPGANSSSFSTTTLANGQRITVIVTADPAYCSSKATSNIITMTVNHPVTPTVSILESANNICAGTTVNFSCVVSNGGTAPVYQWQINGADVAGATGSTFSSSTLSNGDQVRVFIQSNATCTTSSTATSNTVSMIVSPIVTPSVAIAANLTMPVCPGTAVTFTATPVNGGSSPVYQWRVNNTTVGTNGPTFTSSTLVNNDVLSVRMTSNASCVSETIVFSNNITISMNPGTPAIPGAITGNALACPNGTETYTISTVANATAYTWTVPTGWNIAGGQGSNSISVTTGNTGQNGSITVTASNSCGISGARTLAVSTGSVSTPPTGITIANNNTCFGTNKILTVIGGSLGTGATWQWYTGSCGGTLAGTGASITVNPASGTTIYYVRASGNCNTTACVSDAVIVSPGAPTQPDPITGGATSTCPGNSLTYTIAAVNNASFYTWAVPAGWTISSGQGTTSVTVIAGAAGQNGNISVTAGNSCGNSSASTLAVSVAPGTPLTPGSIAGNSDQCINSTGRVYSVAPVPNATTYTWTVPAGWTITSGSGTNSITVSTNGTASSGSISVVAGNTCGNSSASLLPVYVVTNAPAAPGAISGLTAICPVKSVVYSVTQVSGAISYTWTVPTNWSISSGQGTASITAQLPSNAVTGDVSVVANNVCGPSPARTLSVNVANTAWVNAGIDQVVCQGTTSVTLNGSVGGAISANKDKEWDWQALNGGTILPADNLRATYTLPNGGNIPGVYTIRILSNVSAVGCVQTQDEMTVTVMATPTANAGADHTICRGTSVNLAGIIGGGASSGSWSGGTGTYSPNVNTLNAVYTPSATELTAGSVTLTLTTDDPVGTCVAVSDQVVITINPLPTVNAGLDQIICAGSTVSLSGLVSGVVTSGSWSGGTGTFNPNINSLNAVYAPSAAEIAAGSVTLTLTSVDPAGPCNAVSDQVTILINPVATVNAGADQIICANGTALLAGTVGGAVTSGTWSGGTGTFNPNNSSLNAVYIPSAAEIVAGSVTLTLTSLDPAGPCNAVADQVIITINPLATVNAGADQSVCASAAVTLIGTIGGAATSANWSGGTGSFSNPASLNTVYTPSAEEISDGTVTLTLTSDNPSGPCLAVSDQVTITITPSATVNAGVDQSICEGSSVVLSGTRGGAATSVIWSTGGTGSFSPNNTTLNATYLPGNGDTGDVTLTLTTDDPAGSCNATSDQMVISIYPRAIVSAGPNQTICSNGTATMAGAYGGSATSGAWTTSGNGTFSNPTLPSAVYTPGSSDIFNGTVTLTYTTNDPIGPCGPASASMILTINDAIQITSQPANTGVCATYPASFTVTAIGDNLTYQWYRGIAPGGTAVVNSANIAGAQSAALHFSHATSADEGNYYVVISGASECAPVISNMVTLNVDQEITITTPVESNTVCVGDNVTFNIVAEPGGLLTFQWRKDGVNIPGATGNTLTLANVTLANGGSYDVMMAGLAGYTCASAQSAAATLTVNEDATIALSGGNANSITCINTSVPAMTYTIGGGGTGASITAGALPSGMSGVYNASSKTFIISGTPTAAGTFNYTITSIGPCINPSVNGSITVSPNATITLSSAAITASQTVCIDSAITPITYTIGGSATGATATGLPSGVSSSVSGGVVTISGTPTAAGTFNYTITTTGSCINSSVNGSITVNPNATITLSSAAITTSQTVCINSAITPITYSIGGSATGATITGLPSGVSSSVSGGVVTISGTPSGSGTFTYTVTTTGSCVNPSVNGTITVNPNATITLSSAATTTSQTVCINSAITPITYTIGGSATAATVTGLPAGVNGVFSNGVFTISGIPTGVGTFNYTVTTTGSSCINPSLSGRITVNNVGSISLTSGNPNQVTCINTAISNITYAVGGSATGVTAVNLPSGVSGTYNSGLYTLSGIPNTSGTFNFTLTTTGSCASGSISGTITIDPVSVGGVLSPYNSTVCTTTNSGSLSLSSYTGTILRWESSVNAGVNWTPIANTSPTHNFTNIPLTTIFRAVVKSGACAEVYSAPARVVVIPLFEPVITATTVDICNGNSTRLSVSTSILQPVGAFYGGSFNQANPPGWRISENGSFIGFPAAANNTNVGPWSETNGPKTFNGISYNNLDGKFAVVNGIIRSTMETPVFNLFGLPSAELTFTQAYNILPGTTARVELSTDGGNSYNIVLATYTGSLYGGNPNVINPVSINMSPYLGMMNLRIRFNYIGTNGSSWAVEGISVPSQQTDVTYTWSPAETLSSTTDSVVIATPGTTTTYTLTMMVSGCPVIAKSIVIGVANPPVVQTTNACIGAGPVTFTQTGGTLNGTWRVTGGGTINATTGVFTPSVPGCFNASYITPSGTCGDTVSFMIFPAAPLPVVNSGCGPIVMTPPAAIPGFTLQYSFDDGVTWGENTPTAENCLGYRIRTRYITTLTCDAVAGNPASNIAGCNMSPLVARVVDLTAPVITCPANVTVSTNSDACYATLVLTPPVVTDNCTAAPAITVTSNAPAQYPVGQTIVTWTAVDACGNQSTCTQTITVTDNNQPPVFTTCPPDQEQTALINNCVLYDIVLTEPVATDNCGVTRITYTTTGATTLVSPQTGINYVSGQDMNVGHTTITYIAYDAAGNASPPCSFTVTILDVTPPKLTIGGCEDVEESAAANNCSKIPVTLIDPTYSDDCWPRDSLTLSWTMNGATTGSGPGSVVGRTFNVGVTTVTYEVEDPDGNTATCSFNVTILDVTPPNLTIGGCVNVSESATANNCSTIPVTIIDPTYSDNCWPIDRLTLSWKMSGATIGSGNGSVVGQTFNVGVTTVTYQVEDPDGNTANCSFTVTILRLDIPQAAITCPESPAPVMAVAGTCFADVTVESPVEVDPCATVTYTFRNSFNNTDNASGSYPVGTTKVIWTITDNSGNITTCEQIVVVNNLPPTLTCPDPVVVQADFEQPYQDAVTVPQPTYSDNCPNPVLTWTLVPPVAYASEYDPGELSGTGYYPTPNTFYLGVTTINYLVTDSNGATASCSFTITVLAEPLITCLPAVSYNTDPGQCTATRNSSDYGLPVLVRGVQPIIWTWTITNPNGLQGASGTFTGSTATPGPPAIPDYAFQQGTSTITWRAQNVSGFDECIQTVTVTDNQAPTFTVPDAFTECVESLSFAVYDPATNDISPVRPDWYILERGSDMLDIKGLTDNCCTVESMIIHWRIDLSGGSSITGTGQPSAYGSDIRLPGDVPPYDDVLVHLISFWVEDCHGNTSSVQTQNIRIQPRPNLTKGN